MSVKKEKCKFLERSVTYDDVYGDGHLSIPNRCKKYCDKSWKVGGDSGCNYHSKFRGRCSYYYHTKVENDYIEKYVPQDLKWQAHDEIFNNIYVNRNLHHLIQSNQKYHIHKFKKMNLIFCDQCYPLIKDKLDNSDQYQILSFGPYYQNFSF